MEWTGSEFRECTSFSMFVATVWKNFLLNSVCLYTQNRLAATMLLSRSRQWIVGVRAKNDAVEFGAASWCLLAHSPAGKPTTTRIGLSVCMCGGGGGGVVNCVSVCVRQAKCAKMYECLVVCVRIQVAALFLVLFNFSCLFSGSVCFCFSICFFYSPRQPINFRRLSFTLVSARLKLTKLGINCRRILVLASRYFVIAKNNRKLLAGS